MAPSFVETATEQLPRITLPQRPAVSLVEIKEAFFFGPEVYDSKAESEGTGKFGAAKFPKYLPSWDPNESYPPIEPFEHEDRGKNADPGFPNLLPKSAVVEDITGNIGAEVKGIQLSQLSDAGKDELALFVAQKKVVAFRDQDFASLSPDKARDFAKYFGPLQIHVTSGHPKGYPEFHIVHRGAGDTTAGEYFQTRTNSITWHSDISYERQPPGPTFLFILEGPPAGGDTLFVNQVAAWKRLSPEFRKRLEGLKAVHSGYEQAYNSANENGVVRREPVANEHPIVRTHPATGEKALYVNPQFTRRIVGFKKEESDAILQFLYNHMALSQDIQCRLKWAPGTVVVWDNRVTAHSAVQDWEDGHRRHLARLTPLAEKPFETQE